MPIYLRHDSIRLLEAATESLHLAISSLGVEKRITFREPTAKWSVEIGLIGAAAELAMSATLVQASGSATIVWPSGQFKTFSAVLDDFRTLISTAPPSSNFLTKGVADPTTHRRLLHELTLSFRRLAAVRAAGLHAGSGLLWEATVAQGNLVADFLKALSQSTRIRPYLESIPRCLLFDTERTVILEDLSRRLATVEGSERNQTLSSIFLILPDVPGEEPEWISAFERISIVPRDQDIAYLLDILGRALPATMRRTTGGGQGIAVAVRPQDPNAIPIAPQFLRRQFNQIQDQWYADIGSTNGRLEQGFLDLPPTEAVRDVLALGFEVTHILEEGNHFQAQESWPFIASSLSCNGTPGPYWFLVRRTNDLGQLEAQLARASEVGPRALSRNLEECRIGLESIRSENPVGRENAPFTALIDNIRRTDPLRERLGEKLNRAAGTDKELLETFSEAIRKIEEEGAPIGPALEAILNLPQLAGRNYWARTLAEIACDHDDLPVLVRVLAEQGLEPAHTAARKALRRIDFLLYGPPADIPETEED